MFESDGDWDVDQEFLDDIDEKATQYYTQSESSVSPESAKKRKISEDDCSTLKTSVEQDGSCSGDASRKLRTDLVLGLFSKTCPEKLKATADNNASSRQLPNKDISKPVCPQTRDKQSDNAARKNLVLGILTSKNATSSQKTDSSLRDSNKDSKVDGKHCNKVQSKIQDTQYNNDKRASGKAVTSTENKTSGATGSDTLRKQMVLGILQQCPAYKKLEKNNVKKSPPAIKIAQAGAKVAIVRKFPGPAGLMPDKLQGIIPPVSYWNSIDETENKEPVESKLSEFCSQHTKNLFTEGAWQRMLDDLPPEFLADFNIASTKRKANTNSNRSSKIQFLAGIIENIDHSHENPPIVLKDFTDSIRGIVHREIPTKYPALLEPNVVLLLHNVGLLRISGALSNSKYNILISPSSLLGIYTSNGDVVHTPQMKANFGDDCSSNPENSDNSRPISLKTKSNLTKLLTNKNATHTKDTDGILSQEMLELANDTMIFDDDISFCVSPTEITNSQNKKNFATSNLVGNRGSIGKKTETTLKNLHKLSSAVRGEKYVSPTKQLELKPAMNAKTLSEACLSVSDFDLTMVDLNNSIIKAAEKSAPGIDTKIKSDSSKTKPSIKSKLQQFRSNDVLTQLEPKNVYPATTESTPSSTKESTNNKTLSVGSKLFESILSSSQNDSDDEMLSQLDVDSIFSNYDKSK